MLKVIYLYLRTYRHFIKHSSKLHKFLANVNTTSAFLSKMFDVGDLPVPTFGNCVLKTGEIKWPLKLYRPTFLRFLALSCGAVSLRAARKTLEQTPQLKFSKSIISVCYGSVVHNLLCNKSKSQHQASGRTTSPPIPCDILVDDNMIARFPVLLIYRTCSLALVAISGSNCTILQMYTGLNTVQETEATKHHINRSKLKPWSALGVF